MSGKRRQYDGDFKVWAVELLERSEDSSEQVPGVWVLAAVCFADGAIR